MIVAASWFSAEDCGVIAPHGRSQRRASPAISSTDEMLVFIGRPMKYLFRMTTAARLALGAAHLSRSAAGWNDQKEVGLVAAGYQPSVEADTAYFRDYVVSGRSMGRGNLFIYTLPTSALGEIAIALSLTGPSLHLHDPQDPVGTMASQAAALISDGEATGMLCLFGDAEAAVCLAIDNKREGNDVLAQEILRSAPTTPVALARALQQMAPKP